MSHRKLFRPVYRAAGALFIVGFSVVFAGGLIVSNRASAEPKIVYAPGAEPAAAPGTFTCRVAQITDGDTLRCTNGTRVRIAGINSRELDGTCNVGAPCPAASAREATSALSALARGQVLDCKSNGKTYNRIAAFCRTTGGIDLSCAMLDSGTVARWDRHWAGHRC